MNTLTVSVSDFKASPARIIGRVFKGDRVFLRNNRRPQEAIQLVPVKIVYVPTEEIPFIDDEFTREEFRVFSQPSLKIRP